MPCYFFTYHGYGSWMPDRKQGFVRRKKGILAPDPYLAECYRNNQSEESVCFDRTTQRVLIDACLEAFTCQELRGHSIATDESHLHVLVSWRTEKPWKLVRRQLQSSLTRRLNRGFGQRTWFAKQPSRRRVRNREHFEYLMNVYLPRHRGWKWREDIGVYSRLPGDASHRG